ncbi:MAG: hypothetical protein OXN27_07370 [Candidatus Poribacteria bacterium]|nr:hypothetical protein [Candidatus Poribacteria bacterium]
MPFFLLTLAISNRLSAISEEGFCFSYVPLTQAAYGLAGQCR